MKPFEIKHKGATINKSIYTGFEWQHPNYVDADWNGDIWVSYGCGYGATVEDCKEQIDEFMEDKSYNPKVFIVELRRRSFFKRLIMIPRMWRKQVMIMSWGTWNQWRANISHMIVSVKIVLGK